ncbi:MAG TPA: hypothetical protein VJP07_10265 [Dehalococcoidia bacterium]|nr:hypothetical protein [Dehalococcoidia bacterium]
MPIRAYASSPATVLAKLDSTLHAFPEDSRPAARELVLAVSSVLARLDAALRADIDAELDALRACLRRPRLAVTNGRH